MYIGTQVGARGDSDLEQWAQLGVVNVCSDPPGSPHEWVLDDLKNHVEKLAGYGITLDMIQIPLSSTPLETSQSPNVMLGKSPERDREIESIQNIVVLLVNILERSCNVVVVLQMFDEFKTNHAKKTNQNHMT